MKLLGNNVKPLIFKPKISYLVFGIFLLSYVGYCVFLSDSECIYYFGRTGLRKSCESFGPGIINLSFFSMLGVALLIVGSFEKKVASEDTDISR